jgi:hypothetical protein
VLVTPSVGLDVWCVFAGGSSPSRHPPNQPGYLHDEVDVGDDEVDVTVGAGAGSVEVVFTVVDVVVSSLQPNQPGVLHVEVDDVDVLVVLLCDPVVDSSRHPHQPGVLHVSVLVRTDFVDVGFEVDVAVCLELVVVVPVPLLSK